MNTTCYNCGGINHIAKNCTLLKRPKPLGKCYNCGQFGHISYDCNQFNSGPEKCYECGQTGHIAKECKEAQDDSKKKCYACGQFGHISTSCTSNNNNLNSREEADKCYTCGGTGHWANECSGGRGANRGGISRGGYCNNILFSKQYILLSCFIFTILCQMTNFTTYIAFFT